MKKKRNWSWSTKLLLPSLLLLGLAALTCAFQAGFDFWFNEDSASRIRQTLTRHSTAVWLALLLLCIAVVVLLVTGYGQNRGEVHALTKKAEKAHEEIKAASAQRKTEFDSKLAETREAIQKSEHTLSEQNTSLRQRTLAQNIKIGRMRDRADLFPYLQKKQLYHLAEKASPLRSKELRERCDRFSQTFTRYYYNYR